MREFLSLLLLRACVQNKNERKIFGIWKWEAFCKNDYLYNTIKYYIGRDGLAILHGKWLFKCLTQNIFSPIQKYGAFQFVRDIKSIHIQTLLWANGICVVDFSLFFTLYNFKWLAKYWLALCVIPSSFFHFIDYKIHFGVENLPSHIIAMLCSLSLPLTTTTQMKCAINPCFVEYGLVI